MNSASCEHGRSIPFNIPVIDFRRQSMILQWHALEARGRLAMFPGARARSGIDTRLATQRVPVRTGRAPAFADGGGSICAVGKFSLHQMQRGLASFGLRRRFTVESASGVVLASHSYWTSQGDDFFSWLVSRIADPQWRAINGQLWSEGSRQPYFARASAVQSALRATALSAGAARDLRRVSSRHCRQTGSRVLY